MKNKGLLNLLFQKEKKERTIIQSGKKGESSLRTIEDSRVIKDNCVERAILELFSGYFCLTTYGTQGKWLHLSDPKLILLNT